MDKQHRITFSSETNFVLVHEANYAKWLIQVASLEGKQLDFVDYIFMDDAALLNLNQSYLNHDYYTDVITFDYSNEHAVSGDVFISIERIEENAVELKSSFEKELSRIMVHGLLHLCGYKDKTTDDKLVMTSKEDYYLNLQTF